MQRLNVNKLKKCIFFIALFGFLIPGISGTVAAQERMDFGEVPVDKPKSMLLNLQNNNEVPIMVISKIMDGNLGFTTYTGLVNMNPGDKYDLEVTFTPTKEGPSSDELRIYYFASVVTKAALLPQSIPVTGIGIAEADPTIEGLLEFYNDSVENGDLIGYGKGKSDENRLNVFGKMLEKAKEAIDAGDIDEGLSHLKAAFRKINVFVVEGKDGSAIPEIKEMIGYLVDNLKLKK